MDFEQKFLEELEKYKRKRSLSALADKAGVGQSDLSRALGKKGQKLKIEDYTNKKELNRDITVYNGLTVDYIFKNDYFLYVHAGRTISALRR